MDELPIAIRSTAVRLSQDIGFSKIIRKGCNGFVLVGHNRLLKRDVVVKFYYWGGGDHAEPALLAELECDHVLNVFHAESIDQNEAYFMAPFCEHGDLDDALEVRKFGPLESLDALLQVAAGVSYMHGKRLLHRDLKPSNIFCLKNTKYVIGDFGSVILQTNDGSARSLTRHSLIYRPPEEIRDKIVYKQSDIYQLGILFYQLLGGKLPYDEYDWLSEKQKSEYRSKPVTERQFFASDIIEGKILGGKVLELKSLPPWVPSSLKTVIRRCCNLEIDKRFETVADLAAKLNNMRSDIPDWRIESDPYLFRRRKTFRLTKRASGIRVEKHAGGGWRVERRLKPQSMAEAVEMAEAL